MQLLERTQVLLKRAHARDSLREIADAGSVPYDWLKRFANGDIPNPGIKNLQALHDYLNSRKSNTNA
jgi:hypothetical protein